MNLCVYVQSTTCFNFMYDVTSKGQLKSFKDYKHEIREAIINGHVCGRGSLFG